MCVCDQNKYTGPTNEIEKGEEDKKEKWHIKKDTPELSKEHKGDTTLFLNQRIKNSNLVKYSYRT